MNVSSLPAGAGHAFSVHSPVDTSPVGLESKDQPHSTLKPIERLADSSGLQRSKREAEDRSHNQPDPARRDDAQQGVSASADSEAGDNTQARAEHQVQQHQLEQDRQRIRELAARDREVRAHEQAHAAVGGQLAGAPKYQFERGPDGVNYAVGGEVPIDVSPGATPEETIAKAATIRRAALAPAEPSPQDRSVAAQASQLEAEARREMRTEAVEEQRGSEETNNNEIKANEESSAPTQEGASKSDAVSQEPPTGIAKPVEGYISSQTEPGSLLDSIV